MARTARINKGGDHRIANVSKSERERYYSFQKMTGRTTRRETFQKVARDLLGVGS